MHRHQKVIKWIFKEARESHCAQEAGATIEGIRKEVQGSAIDISLEYSNGKPRHDKSFEQEPGPVLIKECDEKSKKLRSELQEDSLENTPWIAENTPTHNGIIKDKAIKTLIREIDAQRHEEECAKSKIP